MVDLEPKSTIDAEWWDQAFRDGRAQSWTVWDRRMTELVARDLPPNGHVLMLACGSAIAVSLLHAKRPDLSWTLCDYSAEALAAARAKFAVLSGPIIDGYVQADLSQPWPWPDDAFDAVLCTELLEHLDDPQFALSELGRVTPWAAITMPADMSLLADHHKWKFEPQDIWTMARVKLVHKLREGKLMLGIMIKPHGYDRKKNRPVLN